MGATKGEDGKVPTFQVGSDPTCLPTSYFQAAYYSPGICPSGYVLGKDLTTVSTAGKQETLGKCCYSSYTYDFDLEGCVSYINPANAPRTTGSDGAPAVATGVVTGWTVVAEYTSYVTSTSIFSAPRVRFSSVVTSLTTSRTRVSTVTSQAIISGNLAAAVVAPDIWIRWATTDQAVLDWIVAQDNPGNGTEPGPVPPPPPPPPPPPADSSLSAGAIAGIAIGAVAALSLVIAALVLFLRRRRKQAEVAAYSDYNTADPTDNTSPVPVYTETVMPKSELDSRALSPDQYAAQSPPQEYKPFIAPAVVTSQSRDVSGGGYQAYRPPASEIEGTEIHPTSPSLAGSGSAVPERARSPSEWTDSTAQPDTDMSGFMIKDGSNAAGARTSVAQLEKLKEERARLQRLQEIAEQEARLEEQLERELAAERRA